MNATFKPVKGFKIEFIYDRADLSQAIAAQVAGWINGIASSFLSLCEATVSSGHQARAQVNHRVIQAREGVVEATTHTAAQAKELAVELVIATLRRIQHPILGLVLPPLNLLVERYLGVRNTVQSALTAYIEGAAGEPIQLNALAQGSVMLPSGEAALEGQELWVPKSDDEALPEAKSKHPVAQEEEESQSLPLSDERPKALEGDQENDQETRVATPKRRGRGRSAK